MPVHDPTRREFLAASAIGLLGVAGVQREESPQETGALLYVGTYTEDKREEGIFLVRMDRTGALRKTGAVRAGPNPSYLALHPTGRMLYAVNEIESYQGKPSGAVSAFSVAERTGELTPLGPQQASEGGAPCYVSVDASGRAVLVANYVGGNIAVLPVNAGGLGTATSVVKHSGRGPNTERQEAAHAHCIIPDPSNRYALAADLGIDKVLVYRLDAEKGTLTHVESGDARLAAGAGPRHLAFHPKLPIVYVANELDSTVTSLRFDAANGTLTVIETRSCLPTDWKGTSFTADIHLTRDGRNLYVSNRGHNSIAMFAVDAKGAIELKQTISTEGDWPRNFALEPSERFLLVANQRSNDIVVLARDANGRLNATGKRLELPSPVCIRFWARKF